MYSSIIEEIQRLRNQSKIDTIVKRSYVLIDGKYVMQLDIRMQIHECLGICFCKTVVNTVIDSVYEVPCVFLV